MTGPLRIIAADPALRLVALALLLLGAGAASIGPHQSLLAVTHFGLSDAGYSLLLAAASAISVTAALAVGVITDQRGRRRLVGIVSALLFLAGLAVVWILPNAGVFVAAHGLILPIASSLFGQLFALARLATLSRPASERDTILATVRALFALPFIVVLPLWSLAFRQGAGLLDLYIPAALAAGICLWLILRAWPHDDATAWADPKSGLSPLKALAEIAAPGVAGRIGLLGVIASGSTLYMVLLGLVFAAAPGRGIADTALFAGLVAGLEVPVMLAIGGLSRLTGRNRLIALATLVQAGFLLAFPYLVESPAVWLLVLPAAFGNGVLLTLPIAYLQDLVAARPGMGGALLAVQRVVGDVTCAAAFALGTLISGYGLAAALGAGLLVIAALAVLLADS